MLLYAVALSGSGNFSAIGTLAGPPGRFLMACRMISTLWTISSMRTWNRA